MSNSNEIEDLAPHEGLIMPAPRSPHARDQYMQALAMQLSEERLRNGTASSGEVLYWLNRSNPKTALEIKNLEIQNELLKAKRDAVVSETLGNAQYEEAMKMFSGYMPSVLPEEGEE